MRAVILTKTELKHKEQTVCPCNKAQTNSAQSLSDLFFDVKTRLDIKSKMDLANG